ncbi:DHH family phosphoesterase [Oceanobacillus kimchii]|uniref:Single-stranded-DNA-specific exonuclease RecJ n=1 Tax=Oceanobacillus kimchii TaxID=746691 RepID=A0ABQ5TKY9_9BACI|nr:DHH family phosphoesterase [Oceanobacillus kimchii]GLO66259.1 hypothetical protein MACH08_20430 [Oceanobacillus kimchii]
MLRNIHKAIERFNSAIKYNEKIVIHSDIDPDGISATVIMYDYIKKLERKALIAHAERSDGHGVVADQIDKDVDLLIIVDSSSSEVDEVNKLAEHMDVIILDHHNVEESNITLNAILVNPNQQGCEYPNKDISGAGVTFRFIEALDYTYKKTNINRYLDLVGLSLLSDQMKMNNLENRYFVDKGMSKINNVGLLALIRANKHDPDKVNAQIMNFDIIPVLNTTTRNDEIKKAFSLLLENDYFKALKKAEYLIKDNKKRKEKVKELYKDYQQNAILDKFVYAIDKNATKNYNGLVATKFAQDHHKPSFVLKDDGDIYQGSYRSYGDFDLQSFLKKCPYTMLAAGHPGAGGFKVKTKDFEAFRLYVDENIDNELFKQVLEYDLELTEEDLTWNLVNEIEKFDRIWGNSNPKITVKINDVFVEDREVFPQNNPSHTKIKADLFDSLKFNDADYADDIGAWDKVHLLGNISINEWQGNKRVQLFIDDYRKN